jgi:hypothetical protein
MKHTNRVRVILGGLLAGVVINVVEFVTHGVILRDAWEQGMQALGMGTAFSAKAIIFFNIAGFLLGIASVWIYAAIRPRYGAGANTAVRAGIAAWVLAVFLPNLSTYPMNMFPVHLLVIATIVSVVDIVLGTIIGAWVYSEEQKKEVQPTMISRAAA